MNLKSGWLLYDGRRVRSQFFTLCTSIIGSNASFLNSGGGFPAVREERTLGTKNKVG